MEGTNNDKKIKSKIIRIGVIIMLDEEICKLRKELNRCITDGEDYSKIYKVSVELDKLIAKYYKDAN